MAREATKAAGNMYYEARMYAAKFNERLKSRTGASELLGISESQLARYELGVTKDVPVDIVCMMSDAYNCPELRVRYCKEVCPIGCNAPISAKLSPIERITIQLLKALDDDDINGVMKKLISVAADGEVTGNELNDVDEIVSYFDKIITSVTELKILAKKAAGESKRK